MSKINGEQVYHILQNLSNLEIAYLDFSQSPKDFIDYSTYIQFFNNQTIKNHQLSRFYFQHSFDNSEIVPEKITDLGDIPENLQILPNFDFSMSKQFNFPNPFMHACDYFSLIYLMDGKGSFYIGEKEYAMMPGDFVMIPAKTPYALVTKNESICVCYNIRKSFVAHEYQNIFQDDQRIKHFIMKSSENPGKEHFLFMHTCNSEDIRGLCLSCFAEQSNEDRFFQNAMKNYLSLLFTIALRKDDTRIEASVSVGQMEQHYQDILDYLNKNYQSATLDSTAQYVHFSKQYVCRIIKKAADTTFNQLLINIRLSVVERYLVDSNLSMEKITEISGFSNSAHMSRVFKKVHGVSPSRYRKQSR